MRRQMRTVRSAVTRREFLKRAGEAGLVLGAGTLLPAAKPGDKAAERHPARKGLTERRTYFFNLSHFDTSVHDVVLVAGKQRTKLKRPHAGVLRQARRDHPILSFVPDEHLTHFVENLAMPADAIQLCYLQRIAHGARDGSWDMALLFYHAPTSALLAARERARATAAGLPPVSVKWARYGVTPESLAAVNDPDGEETLHDTASQAVTLVASHPDRLAAEQTAAAHIKNNIIATQPTTQELAQVLTAQGPATTSGGWATLTPLIDPTTKQPYKNSQGQNQYMPQWSQATAKFAGQAIVPAGDTVADDTTLGVNITAIDPTTIVTNDPNAPTHGAIWTLHDGMPAVDQSSTPGLPRSALQYQLTDVTPGYFYSVAVNGVDQNLNVSITVDNWGVRYLGLYIRYLDANGQPIALSTVEDAVKSQFPLWDLGLNGNFDALLDIVNPEFVVLGIPVSTTTVTRNFPLPQAATSAMILAGGLGRGDDLYPATLGPGKTLTIVVNLAVPLFFLALSAAAGYAGFVEQIQSAVIIKTVVQLLVTLFVDTFELVDYDDPASWPGVALAIGQALLSVSAVPIAQLIATSIAAGEATQAVTDAVPLVGLIVNAVFATGTLAQVIETSGTVALSPKTYATELTFTHDVTVTIHHDPNDPAGFPQTAASSTITAQFDNGTPQKITRSLTGTVTGPITETFRAVPFGGQVTVSVGFYSSDGWLAGQGQIGPVPNAAGSCTMTQSGSPSCQTSQTAGDLSLEFA